MESKSKFVVNYHKLHFIHIVSRLDSKSPSKLHEKKHHPYFTKCANTWSYWELVLEYFKRQSIGRWRYGKHTTNKIIWDEYSTRHQQSSEVYKSFWINDHTEQYIKSSRWPPPWPSSHQVFFCLFLWFLSFFSQNVVKM